jgi:hypothetical protein
MMKREDADDVTARETRGYRTRNPGNYAITHCITRYNRKKGRRGIIIFNAFFLF